MSKKTVISARSSGLGDMLNQLVHCIWFASKSDRRCVVDWIGASYYADNENQDVWELVFHSPKCVSIGSLDVYSKSELSIIKLPELLEPSYVETFAVAKIDSTRDVIFCAKPIDFLPLEVLTDIYRDINIKPLIKKTVDDFFEKLPINHIVGVHIRHGNGELYDEEGELELLRRYEARIENVLKVEPETVFFLATDSLFVESWFENRFGAFLTMPKYLPPSGIGALHHPHTTKNTNTSRTEVLIATLQDMYALSLCDKLICDTWSSFTKASRAWGGFNSNEGTLIPITVPRKSLNTNK